MLDSTARYKIISRIETLVLKHHFNIGNIDLQEWRREVDERTPAIVEAENDSVFEQGIHDLLARLKSSHTDFYRSDRNPTKPEHAIGATLRSVTVLDTQRWMFLDVFEDSPAARSGVTPGYLLISVNGIPAAPPEYPAFRFGEEHQLTIQPPNNPKTQNIVVMVPARKATRPRLPFVEPKSVSYRMLTKRVGIVKIAYFSGMFGIRFSKVLDAAIASLKAQGCDRLIIDLRGCIGGSLGFARLVSYMCPGRIPIGYDITRKRQQRGYDVAQLPRVPMPDTRVGVLFRLDPIFSSRQVPRSAYTRIGGTAIPWAYGGPGKRKDQLRRRNGRPVRKRHEACDSHRPKDSGLGAWCGRVRCRVWLYALPPRVRLVQSQWELQRRIRRGARRAGRH